MGGGKGKMPKVPDPVPPPKPEIEVTGAIREAQKRVRRPTSRGLTGTDITGGILSTLSLGKKQLLG